MNRPVRQSRKRRLAALLSAAAGVGLVVAIVTTTTYVSAADRPAAEGLDVDGFVAEQLPEVNEYVVDNAQDLSVVLAALAADPDAAASLGTASGTGKYAIPVTVSGAVASIDSNGITVTVELAAGATPVLLATGAAVNGSAVRDVTGENSFSDFANQSEYQQVANRFKTAVQQQQIADGVTPGATITAVGIYVTGGSQTLPVVTPLSVSVLP